MMIHAKKIIVRTRKEDSAFLYHVLEAHEGLTSYSTIEFKPHDPHRDLELLVAPESLQDLRTLLSDLGELVIILDDPN